MLIALKMIWKADFQDALSLVSLAQLRRALNMFVRCDACLQAC